MNNELNMQNNQMLKNKKVYIQQINVLGREIYNLSKTNLILTFDNEKYIFIDKDYVYLMDYAITPSINDIIDNLYKDNSYVKNGVFQHVFLFEIMTNYLNIASQIKAITNEINSIGKEISISLLYQNVALNVNNNDKIICTPLGVFHNECKFGELFFASKYTQNDLIIHQNILLFIKNEAKAIFVNNQMNQVNDEFKIRQAMCYDSYILTSYQLIKQFQKWKENICEVYVMCKDKMQNQFQYGQNEQIQILQYNACQILYKINILHENFFSQLHQGHLNMQKAIVREFHQLQQYQSQQVLQQWMVQNDSGSTEKDLYQEQEIINEDKEQKVEKVMPYNQKNLALNASQNLDDLFFQPKKFNGTTDLQDKILKHQQEQNLQTQNNLREELFKCQQNNKNRVDVCNINDRKNVSNLNFKIITTVGHCNEQGNMECWNQDLQSNETEQDQQQKQNTAGIRFINSRINNNKIQP